MARRSFYKVITFVSTCTVCALLYVHQEIEIVKASFVINKNQNELSFLLDQRRSLVYNLSRLKSPKKIEEKLFVNDISLCMPQRGNIRHFKNNVFTYRKEETKPKEKGFFLSGIFDRFSTKAEAKVISKGL